MSVCLQVAVGIVIGVAAFVAAISVGFMLGHRDNRRLDAQRLAQKLHAASPGVTEEELAAAFQAAGLRGGHRLAREMLAKVRAQNS